MRRNLGRRRDIEMRWRGDTRVCFFSGGFGVLVVERCSTFSIGSF